MHRNLLDSITWENFLTLVYIVDIIIALTIIFLERKNPSSTLAWIMVLFFLPGIGILFYFLFSQNIARRRIFRLSKREREVMQETLLEQIRNVRHDRFAYSNSIEPKWKELILLNQNYARAILRQGNRISIMTDGGHMLDALVRDISEAKSSVDVEYFIVKNDATGRKLIDVLTQKAREGVQVRLLLDAMGSRQLTYDTLAAYVKAGGKYAFFFPAKIRFFNLMFNYRNHRKIVVIDGAVGYLGGFNIGNEYLGRNKKFGNWRDTHIRIEGDGIHDLSMRFALDWRFAAKEKIPLEIIYEQAEEPTGISAMQIVSCGPDSHREEVKHAYLKMITEANKNIYIQTPYFIPDSSIYDSLINAALSGVDVRIMIPSIPDHIFVYWATYYYCGQLIRSGVKVYIYDNGFLHAKTMVVDGEVCSVGSANFDIRSFRLNFETNAFIYDETEANKLESLYMQDMEDCHELTRALYAKRSYWIRFKEGIAKLISDLL
ncbi:MAG: cardiolipin synthase [Clostridiales Family XIII bacterium]|jgi:cardiolipin synthase|nr:cardiolipin synthase [Clostridiales Family XIII bacterium]